MMDQRLHWVMDENDEHTVCGKPADDEARTTNLELDGGRRTCDTCYTLWTRYALQAA